MMDWPVVMRFAMMPGIAFTPGLKGAEEDSQERMAKALPSMEIVFQRVQPVPPFDPETAVTYQCIDCAFANVDWSVTLTREDTSLLASHARHHAEMMRWYEARILPLLKK